MMGFSSSSGIDGEALWAWGDIEVRTLSWGLGALPVQVPE